MATNIASQILADGAHEDKGQMARMQYFVGAVAVGDMLKTTLGPYGQDKILLPYGPEARGTEKAIITNDGATILSKIWIDNPAAQILVNLSRTQDVTVGDGTTGVVVLAAELLREAELLIIKRMHPQVVAAGYQAALEVALKELDGFAIQATDETKEKLMRQTARTSLGSKIVQNEDGIFEEMAIRAVQRINGETNLDLISVVKVTGAPMRDSYLEEGFLIQKSFPPDTHPKCIENCKILLADTPMDTDKVKIFGAQIKASDFDNVGVIAAAERHKMKQKVDLISAFGCNVFINRQLIYDQPLEMLKKKGITAIEHADFEGVDRLKLLLDCDVTAVYDDPESVKVGTCEKIEEVHIGEVSFLRFSGLPKSNACTIVLRGPNQHVLDESERSFHDTIAVLSQTAADNRYVLGGGAIELALASRVERAARERGGKISTAMMSFARALRSIPMVLADNAGHNAADIVADLEYLHYKGGWRMGVDLEAAKPADMGEKGVIESLWSKSHQIRNAVETTVCLVRCDEIIRCAPRRREGV